MHSEKTKLKKPKLSEAERSLQHAVVRGDQKEMERLREIIANEKKVSVTNDLWNKEW